MEYDNTNRGALFRNNKRTSDKSPEYNGSLNVDGVEHWISGWVKEAKDGSKFFSLSVQPKEKQEAPKQASRQAAPPVSEDIPFAPRKDY